MTEVEVGSLSGTVSLRSRNGGGSRDSEIKGSSKGEKRCTYSEVVEKKLDVKKEVVVERWKKSGWWRRRKEGKGRQ